MGTYRSTHTVCLLVFQIRFSRVLFQFESDWIDAADLVLLILHASFLDSHPCFYAYNDNANLYP